MKDRESLSPVMTPERAEQAENFEEEARARSRGKRRTAKEIANMFEQLKQRHMTRKKEWQLEKEDLLKKAAIADESKRILSDLKLILEDLRIALRCEESKRRTAEEEHILVKKEWEEEKIGLIQIIKDLESQQYGNFGYHNHLANEMESLKKEMSAREQELTAFKIAHSELQERFLIEQRQHEEEKLRLVENHEGEKSSWNRIKKIMLEKIELLQEQNNSSPSNLFPLHGRHVATPKTQTMASTSSTTDDRSSSDNIRTDQAETTQTDEDMYSKDASTSATYNHFQRTVDEALKQIEKISKDLDNNAAEEKSRTAISPLPSTCANFKRSRSSSFNLSRPNNRGPVDRSGSRHELQPFSSTENALNVEESNYTNYSCHEQQATSEEISRSYKSKLANPSKNMVTLAPYDQSAFSSNRSRHAKTILDTVSPTLSSSTNSCSLPVFTESGTDSPLLNAYDVPLSDSKTKHSVMTLVTDIKKETQFERSEPKLDKAREEGDRLDLSSKKLPNLHQLLLFKSDKSIAKTSDKITSVSKVSSLSNKPSVIDSNVLEEKENKLHTIYFNPESGCVKNAGKSSFPMRSNSVSTSCKEQTAHLPRENDFIQAPASNRVAENEPQEVVTGKQAKLANQQKYIFGNPECAADSHWLSGQHEEPPPPVRPKPSVTIEKDAKGNLLRVITDPRFQTQSSSNSGNCHHQDKEKGKSIGDCTNNASPCSNSEKITDYSGSSPCIQTSRIHQSNSKEEDIEFKSKAQTRGNLGRRGKSWIKKRLSFLDSVPKETQENEITRLPNEKQNNSNYKKKTPLTPQRSGKERRKLFDVTTSEESDDTKHRQKRRGDKSKNEGKAFESKSRKRYSRSKTDSSLEVKNLLSKFRATQFNSKKPAIVKQFEKRLLENEVRTLVEEEEEEAKVKRGDKQSKEKDELRATTRVLKQNEDDGYSGEDEQEDLIIQNQNRKKVTKAFLSPSSKSLTLTRASSIASLQQPSNLPKVFPKPKYHKSLMDIHLSKNFSDDEQMEERNVRNQSENKCFGTDDRLGDLHSRQHDQLSNCPHNQNFLKAKHHFETAFIPSQFAAASKPVIDGTLSSNPAFLRASLQRRSLQQSEAKFLKERSHKKRLSWSCYPPVEHADAQLSKNKIKSLGASKPNLKTSSHVLKESSHGTSFTSLENHPHLEETPVASMSVTLNQSEKKTHKPQISEEMLKKRMAVERALRHDKSMLKPQQHLKSETQAAQCISSNNEKTAKNDDKEFLHYVPKLMSRFKKPVQRNRRLPSRWKKNEETFL